jgi:hypothetical protein
LWARKDPLLQAGRSISASRYRYRALTLSKFQNTPTPPAAPEVKWPKIDKKLADANPFAYLNFVLTLCPPTGPAAVEISMRARFAKIGVEAGHRSRSTSSRRSRRRSSRWV